MHDAASPCRSRILVYGLRCVGLKVVASCQASRQAVLIGSCNALVLDSLIVPDNIFKDCAGMLGVDHAPVDRARSLLCS